jgi:predicted heme/steroid binding protein
VTSSERTVDFPVYTRAQLALRNGTDRDEIWCAYQGLIYDVSSSRLWRTGKHYEHWAGQDLTHELADAPHSEWVFKKFAVVGRLE